MQLIEDDVYENTVKCFTDVSCHCSGNEEEEEEEEKPYYLHDIVPGAREGQDGKIQSRAVASSRLQSRQEGGGKFQHVE